MEDDILNSIENEKKMLEKYLKEMEELHKMNPDSEIYHDIQKKVANQLQDIENLEFELLEQQIAAEESHNKTSTNSQKSTEKNTSSRPSSIASSSISFSNTNDLSPSNKSSIHSTQQLNSSNQSKSSDKNTSTKDNNQSIYVKQMNCNINLTLPQVTETKSPTLRSSGLRSQRESNQFSRSVDYDNFPKISASYGNTPINHHIEQISENCGLYDNFNQYSDNNTNNQYLYNGFYSQHNNQPINHPSNSIPRQYFNNNPSNSIKRNDSNNYDPYNDRDYLNNYSTRPKSEFSNSSISPFKLSNNSEVMPNNGFVYDTKLSPSPIGHISRQQGSFQRNQFQSSSVRSRSSTGKGKASTVRPLTKYLPNPNDPRFNLRTHIESNGHTLALMEPLVSVTAYSCYGILYKLSSSSSMLPFKFKIWKKKSFIFDRNRRVFAHYANSSSRKLKGQISFDQIVDVYSISDSSNINCASNQSKSSSSNQGYQHHQFAIRLLNPWRQDKQNSNISDELRLCAPNFETKRVWLDVLFTGANAYLNTLDATRIRLVNSCANQNNPQRS